MGSGAVAVPAEATEPLPHARPLLPGQWPAVHASLSLANLPLLKAIGGQRTLYPWQTLRVGQLCHAADQLPRCLPYAPQAKPIRSVRGP